MEPTKGVEPTTCGLQGFALCAADPGVAKQPTEKVRANITAMRVREDYLHGGFAHDPMASPRLGVAEIKLSQVADQISPADCRQRRRHATSFLTFRSMSSTAGSGSPCLSPTRRGKRLFREGGVRQALTLLDSKTTTTGVQILTYRTKKQWAAP